MLRRLKSKIFKGSHFCFFSLVEEENSLPMTINFRSLILMFFGDSPALINSRRVLVSSCSSVCPSLLRALLKTIGFPYFLSIYPLERIFSAAHGLERRVRDSLPKPNLPNVKENLPNLFRQIVPLNLPIFVGIFCRKLSVFK